MTDNLPDPISVPERFADVQIVSSLPRQFSWSRFPSHVYVKDPLQRDRYAEMCQIEHWRPRALQEPIQAILFERTALQVRAHLAQREVRDA